MPRAGCLVFALAACGSPSPPPPGARDGSAAPASGPYAPIAKPPAAARRVTPPPPLAAQALAVGARAPAIALADADGKAWTLGDTLAKHARVMLVFYRGDW